MTAVPLIWNQTEADNLASTLGATSGVDGTNHAVDVLGAAAGDGSVLIGVWTLDLGSCTPADVVSVSIDSTYSRDTTLAGNAGEFGAAVFVGKASSLMPMGAYTATAGDAGVFPSSPWIATAGYEINGGTPLSVPTATQQIAGTWVDGGLGLTQLDLVVLVDGRDSPSDGTAGAWSDLTKPTVDVTFAPGSPCAAVVPNTTDDTATTPVNVPVTVSVGTNDDPSPCAPGCMVHRQPTTNFVDPASTATGIVASVDAAGVATVQAATPGTAIIHTESGCSPSCDANGTDVVVWTTQTLTVTVTPAVTPGPCVDVPLVFNPTATAALAAASGSTAGTGGDTIVAPATMGGAEGVLNVFDVDLGACSLADVTSITVAATYLKSGIDHDPASDGGLIAVGDIANPPPLGSPTSISGDTAPGLGALGLPGGVSRDFINYGGTLAASGDPLGATWAVPSGQTALQVVVLAVANIGDASTTVTLPTVCVTFAPGSPCAPAPLPCVEVPVTFSQSDTDAVGAAFGIDPTTDPTSVEADADIAGKQTIGVWLIELPEGCDAEVVSVQAVATVDVSATMDPDEDGAFIAIVDQTLPFPAGFGTLAATSGDADLQFPGSLSTGYTSSGGTAWPAGPSTVTLDGTWSNGTLPASTLALLVYADALGTSPSGSNIRVNVPETVCVTFANPCGPPDPIPVDDTANTTTGTTITVDAAANDNNTPCDPLPGCAVYREGVPFVDPSSTATGITASIDAAGEVTFTATGAGVAILNVESGCSPTCDPTGSDVTTWVTQTVTITVTEPTVPCAAQLVKTCLAETPIVGCAEFGGVPTSTILHSVTGANGDVIPVGSVAHPAANGVGSDGSGFIRSYYTDIDGTVVAPDAGTFTPGGCPTASPSIAFTAGGASIGSGVYAATLGPDGTSWSAPTGLRSLTVAARRANITDATSGAGNRVDVVLNTGTFRLLEGETFTWSVDDPDSFVAGSVSCAGDAAAAVVWVSL